MFEIVPKLLDYVLAKGHLPSFIVGCVGAGVLAAFLVPYFLKWLNQAHKREVSRLRRALAEAIEKAEKLDVSNEDLAAQRDRSRDLSSELTGIQKDLREQITQLSDQCETSLEEQIKLRQRARHYRKKSRDLELDVARLTKQLADIANTDGQVWDRPPIGTVAPFKTLNLRKMPIISVVNLKGGVGKTTITANLGVAFAKLGLRVLLIDLDHQCSLTTMCLNAQELEDHYKRKMSVCNVFTSPKDSGTEVHGTSIRLTTMENCEAFLIGGVEAFAQVETQLQDRWSAQAIDDDVRYRLRAALHSDSVRDRFDVVLLDCPPRLTTGCINALTASDFVITPVLLERRSTEAVPRLLKWIRKMRPQVCPDLTFLGVVANRTFPRAKLIVREQNTLNNMQGDCIKEWDSPVRVFKSVIRDHSTTPQRFAALDPKHQLRYLDLAKEVLQEIPSHARRNIDSIPALPLSSPGSLRS